MADFLKDIIIDGQLQTNERIYTLGGIRITGGIYDQNNSIGTAGQLLTSDGTNVEWVNTSQILGTQSNVTYYDVKNTTGATISKGKVVMAVGTDGNSGHILIDEMVADGSVEPRYILGVLNEDITHGTTGQAIYLGQIKQLNTTGQNGETWSDGTVLWCDPNSPGDLTQTEPNGPNLKIPVAIVLNAATNGKIQVRATYNEGIHDLHDTKIVNQVDGDILVWDNTTGVWFNDSTLNVNQGVGVDITGTLDVSYLITSDVGINLGTSEGLRLFNNGNSFIDSYLGYLYIRQRLNGGDILIQTEDDAGSVQTALFIRGSEGDVSIRHQNTERILTTSTGVDITGNLDVSGSGTFGDDITIPNNTSVIAPNSTGSETSQLIGTTGSNGLVIGQNARWASTGIYSGGLGYTLEMDSSKNSTFNGNLDVSGTGTFSGTVSITEGLFIGTTTSTSRHTFTSASDSPVKIVSSDTFTGIQFTDTNGSTDLFYEGSSDKFYSTSDWDINGNVNASRFILPSTGTTSPVSNYLFTDNTATGTGRLIIQAGEGSSGFGGGINLFSHSHATKPGWVTAGISANSGGKFTVNTEGLAGGTDVFVVEQSGNVGIGTTSPATKLHLSLASSGASPYQVITTPLTLENSGRVILQMLGPADQYLMFGDTTTANQAWLSYNHATDQMGLHTGSTITMDGKVGIGTTSPVGKLEVVTEDSNRYIRFKAPNGEERFQFYTGGTGNPAGLYMYSEDGTTRNVQISAGGTSYFNGGNVFFNGGNVGIGTNSASAKLNIANEGEGEFAGANSNSAGGSHLILRDEGGTSRTLMSGPSIVFQTPANSDGTNIWATSRILGSPSAAGSARGTISLQVRDNYDPLNDGTSWNWRTALTVINTGNVGIGTTSPSYPLEISGTSTVSLAYQRTGVSAKKWGFHSDNSNTYWQNLTDNILALTLSNAGNVGIGTTNPGSRLTVSGTNNATSEITLINTNPSTDNDWSITPFYNDQTLRFRTNSATTTVMTLKDNGNVGIGTTNPAYLLDVQGAAKFASPIHIGSVTNALASGSGDLFLSSGRLTIASNDNVGIGSASPVGKLEVHTGSSGAFFTRTAGDNGTVSPALALQTSSGDTRIGSSGKLAFLVGAVGTAVNVQPEVVTIATDGNVGIGTTSPGAKLDVRSTDTSYVAAFRHSTTTGYAPGSILLEAGQGGSRGQGIYHYNNVADENWFTGVPYNVSSKKWIVANKYSTTQDVDTAQLQYALLTIDSDTGNVGIGTTSPSKKLEVVGEIKANAGNDEGFILNGNNGFLRHNGTGAKIRTNGLDALIIDNSQNTAIQGSGSTVFDFSVGRDLSVSGEVGIGTTNPAYKLEVSGNAALSIGGDRYLRIGSSTNYWWDLQSVSNDFTIKEAGSNTRVIVKAGGNVGIGTTSPSAQLEIRNNEAGDGVGGATLRLTRGDSTSVAGDPVGTIEFYSTDADTAKVTAYIKSMSEELYGREGSLAFGVSQAINTDATEAMRITNEGNVGIGTTSPIGKLDVSDGTNPLTIDSSTYNEIQSYNRPLLLNRQGNNVGIGNSNPGHKLDVNGSTRVGNYLTFTAGSSIPAAAISYHTNGYLYLKGGGSGIAIGDDSFSSSIYCIDNGNIEFNTQGATKMVINTSGNVGIGTTSPTQHISGTETVLHIANTNVASLNLDSTGGSGDCYVLSSTASGKFSIYNDDTNTTPFTILDSGYVGIGTTSPTAKLDVNGDLNVSGTLDVSGQIDALGIDVDSGGVRWKRTGYNQFHIRQSAGSGLQVLDETNSNTTAFFNNNAFAVNTTDTNGKNFRVNGTAEITGTLDVSGLITANGSVKIPDNQSLFLGTDNDLRLWSTNTNTYIQSSLNNLYIQNLAHGGQIYFSLEDSLGNAHTAIRLLPENGQVYLQFDNLVKLKTTSTGIDVTGDITLDTTNGLIVSSGNVNSFMHFDFSDITSANGTFKFGENSNTTGKLETRFYDGAGINTIRLQHDGGLITAGEFIVDGGTASQFLKADGSVDSNTYLTSSSLTNYVTTNTTQTISGTKTFSAQTKFTNGAFAPAEYSTDASNVFTLDLTKQVNELYMNGANKSISNTISNITGTAGMIITLIISQDATGSRTITSWGTGIEFGDAGAPTLSTGANKMDMLSFYSDGFKLFFMGIQKGFSNYTRQTPI